MDAYGDAAPQMLTRLGAQRTSIERHAMGVVSRAQPTKGLRKDRAGRVAPLSNGRAARAEPVTNRPSREPHTRRT